MSYARPNDKPDAATLIAMHRQMLLIRRCEERLERDVKAGNTPGQVHLSTGQEAVPVGLSAHLDDGDKITSTHRGHGHFLAKGGDPQAMFAEIYGMAEGVCGGMGGSMHVADVSKGILGANGIVGAGLAIATGAAFAIKLDGSDRLAACYFGDGAANQGVLMECLNIASLWCLPLLFVCENNGYSEFSPSNTVTSGPIADRARPFGVPVRNVDGNDVAAVWQAALWATDHVRAGRGPVFLEARTYRHSGHFSAEPLVLDAPYRPAGELTEWLQKDPLLISARAIEAAGHASAADLARMDAEVTQAVTEAAEAGLQGTAPAGDAAGRLMFVDREGNA